MIRIGSSVGQPKLTSIPVLLIPVSRHPFLIRLNLQSFKEPFVARPKVGFSSPAPGCPEPLSFDPGPVGLLFPYTS
jgi:hypothetical protein